MSLSAVHDKASHSLEAQCQSLDEQLSQLLTDVFVEKKVNANLRQTIELLISQRTDSELKSLEYKNKFNNVTKLLDEAKKERDIVVQYSK